MIEDEDHLRSTPVLRVKRDDNQAFDYHYSLITRRVIDKMSRDRTRQAPRVLAFAKHHRAACVIVFAESHCLAPIFTFFSLFVSPRMARADRKRGEIIGYRSEMTYGRSAPLCVRALRTTMERPR